VNKLKLHSFYRKFNWDDLIDFKLKAPYLPESWDWLKNKGNTSEPFEFYLNVSFIN
jgi:hypothetical protein